MIGGAGQQSSHTLKLTNPMLRRTTSLKARLKQNPTLEQEPVLGENIENGTEVKFYFRKLLLLDYALLILVCVNISLSIFYYDLDYAGNEVTTCVLYGILVLLIMEIIVIWLRYKAAVELEVKQKLLFEFENLYSTNRYWTMLVEMFIMSLQPYPFFNNLSFNTSNIYDSFSFDFKINYILVMFGFFRIYLVLRVVLLSTSYMSPRSSRNCRMYGCQADYLYSIKCLFKDRPMTLMGAVFILSIFIFALILRMAQRSLNHYYPIFFNGQPDPQDLESFENAIWLTIITMTTVGYGDFYPRTLIGRIIDTLLVVWGVFIVSLMVVLLTNTLNMDSSQQRALIVLNRLQAKKKLKQKSANLIATTFRKHCLIRKLRRQTDPKIIQATQAQLKQGTIRLDKFSKQFSNLNRQIQSMYQLDNVYQQMTRQFQFVNDQISFIFDSQNDTVSLLKDYLHKSNQDSHIIQQQIQ